MIAEIVYGNLISKQTLLEAFDLAETTAPRISAVGAGGKTTTLKRLAAEYTDMGRKPIVTTTTHLFREDSPLFLEDPSVGEILALLDKEGCVFAGGKAGNGKIRSLPAEVLEAVLQLQKPVVLEADGAKMLPVKFPADHEPVILPQTTHILYICGMDAPGRKIKEVCFRAELLADFLGKSPEELLTTQDIAALAQSRLAGRKGAGDGMRYAVVLNKADTRKRRDAALEVWEAMDRRKEIRVIVTANGWVV
ncbi:MAG: putative selenium-dependent hydroxylase accessory protein YqeC [Schaedlerella sp.]|uniref:selenium cofactor biosynthesis protein YqeC n=1 Tax=Schaedlerella sp. TaxID=2676057 RepID=UPI003528B70C